MLQNDWNYGLTKSQLRTRYEHDSVARHNFCAIFRQQEYFKTITQPSKHGRTTLRNRSKCSFISRTKMCEPESVYRACRTYPSQCKIFSASLATLVSKLHCAILLTRKWETNVVITQSRKPVTWHRHQKTFLHTYHLQSPKVRIINSSSQSFHGIVNNNVLISDFNNTSIA